MRGLLDAARGEEADALVLLGDLGGGEVREYADVLRTVGRAGFPTFYVPGPEDAPFGKFLREAHNSEVVFASMHGVHGAVAFAPGFQMLFAGMGGEVQDAPGHQREETEKLSYPGWRSSTGSRSCGSSRITARSFSSLPLRLTRACRRREARSWPRWSRRTPPTSS